MALIVQSFMELLTAEMSTGGGGGPSADGFLAALARIDPNVDWIRPWLHNQELRAIMTPKLAEMVFEIMDEGIDRVGDYN